MKKVVCLILSFLFSANLFAIIPLTEDNFLIKKNYGNYRILSQGQEIVLLEESEYHNAAVLFSKNSFYDAYTISFEYSLYDRDGGQGYPYKWHSADGFAIGIGKNYQNYADRESFPKGDRVGFVEDGQGYGIQFKTYGTREVYISDGRGRVISPIYYHNGIYTSGRELDSGGHGVFPEGKRYWVKVKVSISATALTLDIPELNIHVVKSLSSQSMANLNSFVISSASGAANSEFRIRNFKVLTNDTLHFSSIGDFGDNRTISLPEATNIVEGFFSEEGLDTLEKALQNTGLQEFVSERNIDLSGVSSLEELKNRLIQYFVSFIPDSQKVGQLVSSLEPDFILTAGDNNYDSGCASTIDQNIGSLYADYIGNYQGNFGTGSLTNRFFPTLGNHDWYVNDGECGDEPIDLAIPRPYADYFDLPTESSGTERYYSFKKGDMEFFMLDSEGYLYRDIPNKVDASGDNVQRKWFKAALKASDAKFKVVVFHHPPYSITEDRIPGYESMRWDEFKNVDLVLAGHDHIYSRFQKGSVVYAVNGVGGSSLYDIDPNHGDQDLRASQRVYGAMQFVHIPWRAHDSTKSAVTKLIGLFYSADGVLLDRFEIVK